MTEPSVRRPAPERALSAAQRRALVALAGGAPSDAAAVAAATGMKPNGAALALRGLERRRLVVREEGDGGLWKATFAGHVLAEHMTGGGRQPAASST